MWKERIGNFLSSIPTDFPNLFWLVKWLRVHKVFKSKNRTRNGKPCSRSSPTNGNMKWTLLPKVHAVIIWPIMGKAHQCTKKGIAPIPRQVNLC